eukprot:CAMPEP_0198530172 /NCGR_PEP_ID=MMETSP1462-20131121/26198_1 /TAXON_ID=1333877 /ORGANISM="Brandtodinium nutriculum, Strain RCC3387" /LENGTH=511 /DNA_ID=CAMNT_0044260041 /DNA_START=1 /DNA_END=1536 /DNA_ORIENTATION=-
MLRLVNRIQRDPFFAIQLGDADIAAKNRDQRKRLTPPGRPGWTRCLIDCFCGWRRTSRAKPKKKGRGNTLETQVLENTIIKLGGLLAIGFGEAAAEMICDYIGEGVDPGESMTHMRGTQVEAIYGYCQIQDFTMILEVHQERTILFVNQVARIVHSTVHEYSGQVNKNIGGAFLLVWPLVSYAKQLEAAERQRAADLSVMSFAQVMLSIIKDPHVSEFQMHPSMVSRGSGTRAAVGFGLHLGWSIQGVTGSRLKIDGSYLSPHVSMAMSLEGFARHYRVSMLMTQDLVSSCSREMATVVRAIDRVKPAGAAEATRIYTLDLAFGAIPPPRPIVYRSNGPVHKENRLLQLAREKRVREERRKRRMSAEHHAWEEFMKDKLILRMRMPYTLDFFQAYEKAYVNYEAGEWDVAAQVLRTTATMLKVQHADGPSCALLDFMAKYGSEAPDDWPGYRDLQKSPYAVRGADHRSEVYPFECVDVPDEWDLGGDTDEEPSRRPEASRSAHPALTTSRL